MTLSQIEVDRIEVDRLMGRLTTRQYGQALDEECPDWWGHGRLYEMSEDTWRKTPDQKRADWADGCGHCGKRYPGVER